MRLFALAVFIILGTNPAVCVRQEADTLAVVRELIKNARYNEAVVRLEERLERSPNDPRALSYLGAAVLYGDRDYLKAKDLFELSFRHGEGASFFVNHSHESLSEEDFADYCRGWLYLRRDQVQFVPETGEHGFDLRFTDLQEFKQNRWSKALFHIKLNGKNQNFRPRNRDEREVLLVLALYKKFAQQSGPKSPAIERTKP